MQSPQFQFHFEGLDETRVLAKPRFPGLVALPVSSGSFPMFPISKWKRPDIVWPRENVPRLRLSEISRHWYFGTTTSYLELICPLHISLFLLHTAALGEEKGHTSSHPDRDLLRTSCTTGNPPGRVVTFGVDHAYRHRSTQGGRLSWGARHGMPLFMPHPESGRQRETQVLMQAAQTGQTVQTQHLHDRPCGTSQVF